MRATNKSRHAAERKIRINATSGGKSIQCRMLVPKDARSWKVEPNGMAVPFSELIIENSRYLNFTIDPLKGQDFVITY